MEHAISIKQPWATLVAHGVKTIEIRRWSTRRRGRVMIHAARAPDARPECWAHVPRSLEACTRLSGGIVGEAQLVDCRAYKSAEDFGRDRDLHLNDPSWFKGRTMYGFVFAGARPLPFHRCPGSLYFFEASGVSLPTTSTTGLLVSVRSATEAAAALEGGADLIDIKEPGQGPLGRASDRTIGEVVKYVAGRRPVSAALGELADLNDFQAMPGLAFVKCGLANLRGKNWQSKLLSLRKKLNGHQQRPEVVTVAYADCKVAAAPPWHEVAKFALGTAGGVLLLDTFDKSWRPQGKERQPATLLNWLTVDEICTLCDRCRAAGVRLALAGSLGMSHLLQLANARPTWFAVRGAVCAANKRDGDVHVLKVSDLVEVLRWHQH